MKIFPVKNFGVLGKGKCSPVLKCSESCGLEWNLLPALTGLENWRRGKDGAGEMETGRDEAERKEWGSFAVR
jgi:hypothetical protein